ncbi:MAG TPA: tetratricopeptide repeat protein [Ktedonobacteraceae bacterium]|nr:tetratricopeptide repeat protein [Ktedonobacteraceae bacterium]
MQRTHLLPAIALLAILFSMLLVAISGSHAQAHNTIVIDTPTATPDANQILNQANAVATQAAQASGSAQNSLSIVNFILGFFAFVIALVGAVGISVGIYGFNIVTKYRNQLVTDQAEIAQKKTAIDNTISALVYLGLGDRLFNQDRKQEAVEIYRKVGSLLAGDTQINNVLGRIYSGAGYYEDAIKSFEAALASDSNLAEAHMELGLAYRRHGDAQKGQNAEKQRNADYDKAISHLKRAVDLRPDYEDALAGLGAIYRRMGDKERDLNSDEQAREYYELARVYYEQAYSASPFSSYALGNVASLSWYLAKQDAAYDYFVLARAAAKVRLKTGGRSTELFWDYFDLALAQLVIGTVDKNTAMKDEAIETYNTAIRLTPGVVQLDSVLNNLYLLQKSQQRIDGLDAVITKIEAAKSS